MILVFHDNYQEVMINLLDILNTIKKAFDCSQKLIITAITVMLSGEWDICINIGFVSECETNYRQ